MGIVSVTYFDLRAAAQVFDAFGLRCTAMPPSSSRIVRLDGGIHLDDSLIKGVSNMYKSSDSDDAFFVEFFDVRDAMRVQQHFARADSFNTPKKSLKGSVQTVLIKGLPHAVCTEPMMEAVLQQAGLAHDVLKTQTNEEAIAKCIQHFQGRTWDPSGAKVKVIVKSVQQQAGNTKPKKHVVPKGAIVSSWTDSMGVSNRKVVNMATDSDGAESGNSDGENCKARAITKMAADDQSLWVKPSNQRGSAVTVSTCSSEHHSDVDIEELMA